jgi:hypothetical protein
MAKKIDVDAPQAANDAYTGMLAVSLFALIGGCVLLYLDYSQYPEKPPQIPKAPGIVKPSEPKQDGGQPAKADAAPKADAPPKDADAAKK